MAINTNGINARMQMLQGNEEDFSPEYLLPGEWAVSTDTKYVRMCMAPGVVVRMATYEAFEEDMKKIQDILVECQDIEKAVEEFQKLAATSEANAKASEQAAAGSAELAKGYAEQAKAVSNTQVAINTQTLGYSKKNVFKNSAASHTASGITFTVNEDGSVTANGTATGNVGKYLGTFNPTPNETYVFDAVQGETVNWNYICYIKGIDDSDTWMASSGGYKFTPTTNNPITCHIYITSGTTLENFTFYPMIRSADITDDTYEPYVEDVDTRFNAVETEIEEIPDTYATKEELEGYLPLTGGIVSGETNINGITIKNYYLPDNSGWTKYFLMFDITSWYTSTNGSKSGFTGQIFAQRSGGYMREEIVKIIMGVSYKKVDTEDGAQLCLRTTSTGYIPCIVYDSINEKYYLALKIGGSDRVLCFAGCFQGTYLGTFISATDSTGTMPEGYEVVNSDYKIIVEPRATADADGNNIHNTYIPKSSILNEQEEIEANTDENNVAGALALKELSKNMGGLRFGVDSDGNYGYYKDGADTVTPFKSGGEISVDAVSMLLSESISTTITVSFTGLKSITFKMLTSGTVTVTYDDGTTKDITVNTGSTGVISKTIDVVGANKIVIKIQSSMMTSISIIDYE